MITLDVGDRETIKEKLEEIYLQLLFQRQEMLRNNANPETFSLFACGYICEGLMNHWSHSAMRWRRGRTYLGALNQKWRVFMSTQQHVDVLYTTCNLGTATLGKEFSRFG